MSTLMSTDMITTKSSTRRHAPPGGQTTINLGGGDEPPPPTPRVSPAAPAAAPRRPAFGGAVGVAAVAGCELNASVLSTLSDANAAVTVLEVGDPLLLPFAAQRLLAGGAAAVVAVGSLTGALARAAAPSLVAALLTAGLDQARPVVIAVSMEGMGPAEASAAGAKHATEALRLVKLLSGGGASGKAGGAKPASSASASSAAAASAAIVVAPAAKTLPGDVDSLMATLRASLARQGARGIFGIGRKFRIADDNRSGALDPAEFAKCIKECKLDWTDANIARVFSVFDDDKSGTLCYEEFLQSVRGVPSARRAQLILLAFALLDVDKSGVVDLDDIRRRYDTSKHPDVIAGRKKPDEVLREFLDTFDGGENDGKVSPQEFAKYYATVSASIDDDDYFELMMRNAWHISGGEGWSANSTCRRLLVTHADGRQTVEEITNDLGITPADKAAMLANLKEQGIEAAGIELFGSLDTTTPPPPPGANGASKKPPPLQSQQTNGSAASSASTSPYAPRVRQGPGGNSSLVLG